MRKLLAILLTGIVFFMMSGCGSNDDNNDSGVLPNTSHMLTIKNEARSSANIIAVYLRTPDTDRYDPSSADWGVPFTVNIAPGGWEDILIYECDKHYDMKTEFATDPNGHWRFIWTYDIFLECGEESTYTFDNVD